MLSSMSAPDHTPSPPDPAALAATLCEIVLREITALPQGGFPIRMPASVAAVFPEIVDSVMKVGEPLCKAPPVLLRMRVRVITRSPPTIPVV